VPAAEAVQLYEANGAVGPPTVKPAAGTALHIKGFYERITNDPWH